MTEPNSKIIKTPELINYWQIFGSNYAEYFEYNTQPMLYSLIINLKIYEAKKILELSCGGGKSLSIVCSLKKPDCQYNVTDISENLLTLSYKRMEFIEENFLGNLQFFDASCYDPNEKKVSKAEFQRSNVYMSLMDNEKLEFPDENFDICFSNLSLQIVENPEKMISESFRVVQKGGKVGFTVWASQEKSLFFTIPTMVFERNGVELPKIRSNFHLNDRDLLIKMFEKAGFKNILCWPQFFAYNFHNKKDLEGSIERGIKRLFTFSKNEEQSKQLIEEMLKEFMILINNNEPVGLEVFFILGEKT